MPHPNIPTYGKGILAAPQARPLQLSLQRIEVLTAAEGRHRVPHRHPFHCEVMYIEAGESECFIDGRVYRLKAGDLCGLPAGVIHACGTNDSLQGWVLHCSPEFLATKPREVIVEVRRGNLLSDPEAVVDVERWFEGFAAEYGRVRFGRAIAIKAWLQLMGVYLRRLSPKPDLDARPRPVSIAFRDLLDAQYHHERNPVAYAAQLGITADQLNARLREETGAAAREHIDRRILLEAERLLAFTAMTVLDIATQLGFDDPQYFWRYFRKHTHVTPGEYRERQRQDFSNAGAPGLELPFDE